MPVAPKPNRPPIRLAEMPHSTSPDEDEEEDEGEETLPPPTPFVSYIMIAVLTLIFGVMWWQSGGNLGGLTVNGEYSIADLFGQKNNELIRAGQFWRFLTPVFLHGSPVHLLTNALSIYWLGTQIERIYGGRRYLIIYVLAGIAGNLVSFMRSPHPSLGASGAIFGLVGAGLIFPLRFRSLIRKQARDAILSQLLLITAINIGLGFSLPSVDNWAHMGGLAGGAIVALFLIPDVLDDRPVNRLRETLLSLMTALMLVLIGCAVALQANWTRSTMSAPTTTYASSAKDPYWTVRIPTEWIWSKKEQGWRNPDGARIFIADNIQKPETVREVEMRMATAPPQSLVPRSVDGKRAVALELLARDSNRFVEMVRVEVYDRLLVFVMIHKGSASAQKAARDFDRILRSVRIIHAPTRFDKPNSSPALLLNN